MWITTLCFLVGLLIVHIVAGIYGLVCGAERGHSVVYGAVVASAVTFIVVLIVVPGKWNLASAVSGAAEVNEALTAAGSSGLKDYDQFDVTVRSLRVQRGILLAMILAAIALTVVLTPCFYTPDSVEPEKAVGALELAGVLAMVVTGDTSILQIAISSLNLQLGQALAGPDGGVPGSWSRPLWIAMIVVAMAALILPCVALALTGCHPPQRLLVVVSIVVGLVLMASGVAISATRASPAYAYSDIYELGARFAPECVWEGVWGHGWVDEEGACSGIRRKFNALRGLVPTVAMSGLCIEVVVPVFLRVVMTMEWRCGRPWRVSDA
jgi:hypothetical protein